MADDTVSLIVGGMVHTGWKNIKVRRSIESVAGSFELAVVNKADGTDWNLLTQSECVLKIGDDSLITGYVDEVNPSVERDSRAMRVTGRDKTCDLVDCAAMHKKSSWSLPVKDLVSVFANPFGIEVLLEAVSLGRVSFSLNKGDTAFMCIEKICRQKSLLPTTDGRGRLVLTTTGKTRTDDRLIYGNNVLGAEGHFNMENRFSKYHVFSQSTTDPLLGWNVSNESYGEFDDPEIKRYRPIYLQAESQSDSGDCKTRAKWEAMVRAGASRVVKVRVQGWRQSSGKIWEINKLVDVDIPPLGVNSTMLISEVNFTKNEEGTQTMMTLKIPDAYNPGTRFKLGQTRDFKSTADKKSATKNKQITGW